MTNSDGERVAALEAQMQDLKKTVDKGFNDNNLKMDALTSEVRSLGLTLFKKLNVEQDHEKRLSSLEKSGNLWKWLSPLGAVILGSVLTFLIIEFLKNK